MARFRKHNQSADSALTQETRESVQPREATIYITSGKVKRRHNPIAPLMLLALLCFVASLGAGIGGTYATITQAQKHSDIEPYFDAKLVQKYAPEGETAAYPGFTCSRSAVAQNTGERACWVRMRLEKKWLERDSSNKWVESGDTTLNTDYIEVTLDDTTNWLDGEDGWYYYQPSIEPGQTSSSLLSSISISTQIGEEYNDGQAHDVSSTYIDKAAEVDVYMEATANPYEQQGSIKKLPQTGDTTSFKLFVAAGIAFALGISLVIAALILSRKQETSDEESFHVEL